MHTLQQIMFGTFLCITVQGCGPTCLDLSVAYPVVEKPWPITAVHTNAKGEIEENTVIGTLPPGRYHLRESANKGRPGYKVVVDGKSGYFFPGAEGVKICKEE